MLPSCPFTLTPFHLYSLLTAPMLMLWPVGYFNLTKLSNIMDVTKQNFTTDLPSKNIKQQPASQKLSKFNTQIIWNSRQKLLYLHLQNRNKKLIKYIAGWSSW